MTLLELAHDRHDCPGLSVVSFETDYFQREPAAVDEESDHDLRIDPTLFREPDLAQVVFFLGFEVQGGHVIEQKVQISCGGSVFEAALGDVVAVAVSGAAPQGPHECVAVCGAMPISPSTLPVSATEVAR